MKTTSGRGKLLFCPSSEKIQIGNSTTLELGAEGVKVLKGEVPLKIPVKCRLPRVAIGSESLERVAGIRPRGDPPIILYLAGPVTEARPTFDWESVEGAESYQLTLKNEARLVIWEHRTTASSAAYPQSMPA